MRPLLARATTSTLQSLVPFCRRYVEELAAKGSPASYAIMKRQIYEHQHRGLGAAETEAEQLMKESFNRPDFGEGVKSFTERRSPDFPRRQQCCIGISKASCY